jgi:hypothetical protein
MGDAASAVLVGACAAVAAISFATAYLADLLIPVTPSAPPPPPAPAKEKTLEERVQILEGGTPAPSAPPKEVDPVIDLAPVTENLKPSAPESDPERPQAESIALPPLSTNPNAPRLLGTVG